MAEPITLVITQMDAVALIDALLIRDAHGGMNNDQQILLVRLRRALDGRVVCPNCNGRDTSHWPYGHCTVCDGRGYTTPEMAARVRANRVAAMRER